MRSISKRVQEYAEFSAVKGVGRHDDTALLELELKL
jgi:hypothetical protein